MTRQLTTLQLIVEYLPEETTPDAIAEALDILLSNALRTEGVLDECGDVVVHTFEAEPPYCCYVVADPRNGPVWVDRFVSERELGQFDRVSRYYEVGHDFDWERDEISQSDVYVVDLDKWEAENPEDPEDRDEDADGEG